MYKILTSNFFLIYFCRKKQMAKRVKIHVSEWPRVKNKRGHSDTCINTCANMAACINTRVPLDTCIFYKRPSGHVYLLHVATRTRVINTRGHLFYIFNRPRSHHDKSLIHRVSTVTSIVDTWRVEGFFVVLFY